MNRLLKIGFEVAGLWQMKGDSLTITFQRHAEKRNILYAFIHDGDVRYVGVSTQTLRKRMAVYISPGPKSSTNIRSRANILERLARGSTVEVYALPDSGLMHVGPFHLNLAAGLEGSIIATLAPDWNIAARGIGAAQRREPRDAPLLTGLPGQEEAESAVLSRIAEDEDQEGSDLPEAEEPANHPTFGFVLQPTYWKQGFFNGGVESSPLLGAEGEKIEIFFADEPQSILGTINRTATGNGSPRVFGGPELRRRFQTLPERTHMLVDVLSPTVIRIWPSDVVSACP
jgi:hypothetical protein